MLSVFTRNIYFCIVYSVVIDYNIIVIRENPDSPVLPIFRILLKKTIVSRNQRNRKLFFLVSIDGDCPIE